MITKKIARFSWLAQNAEDLKYGLNKGINEIKNKIFKSQFLWIFFNRKKNEIGINNEKIK